MMCGSLMLCESWICEFYSIWCIGGGHARGAMDGSRADLNVGRKSVDGARWSDQAGGIKFPFQHMCLLCMSMKSLFQLSKTKHGNMRKSY